MLVGKRSLNRRLNRPSLRVWFEYEDRIAFALVLECFGQSRVHATPARPAGQVRTSSRKAAAAFNRRGAQGKNNPEGVVAGHLCFTRHHSLKVKSVYRLGMTSPTVKFKNLTVIRKFQGKNSKKGNCKKMVKNANSKNSNFKKRCNKLTKTSIARHEKSEKQKFQGVKI